LLTSASTSSVRTRLGETIRGTSHGPTAGERDVHRTRRRSLQSFRESRLVRRSSQQALGRLGQQSLARAIDEPQPVEIVERKHGNVDLRHYGPQQRGRFHRTEALRAQRFAKQVRLEERQAERVVSIGAARARIE
jgi:hypothetical protein